MRNPILAAQVPDENDRRGQLLLRTLPILFIPVFISFLTIFLVQLTTGAPRPPGNPPAQSPLVGLVVVIVFFSALITLVRVGRSNLSTYLLIGAWTLFITFSALQNGVTTNWPALLIVPICAAGLLIDSVASISLAVLATILVLSLGYLEAQGFSFRPIALPLFNSQVIPLMAAGFWVGVIWSIALLTSLLARGLQRALAQSRAQAAAVQQLNVELEQRVVTQTAKLLTQEREAAILEERARVARDIHDTLAQGLTGIVVQLSATKRAFSAAPAEVEEHVELAQRLAREALAEARRSIWNLRSPALARGDLGDALRGLTTRPLGSDVQVTFEQTGEPYPLAPNAESALLRVAQEALVNVSKHARATRAYVELNYTTDTVRLLVRDDGQGFSEEILRRQSGTPDITGGFGLLGMCERINALGGTLQLLVDGGALVVATVPCTHEAGS